MATGSSFGSRCRKSREPLGYESSRPQLLDRILFSTPTAKNAPTGGSNIFPDPQSAFSAFGLTFPGQSGDHNDVRGDGFFTIDTGLFETPQMPYNENHSIQIRAEAFNVTNTVRFDVNQLSLSLSNSVSFGKYNGTLNSPRVLQFGGRYEF
jgi:hypothetical protein